MSKTVALHVVIALLAGVRKQGEDNLTKVYQSFKKPDLFSGMDRIYTPIKDDGIVYPEESKVVQSSVPKSLESLLSNLINYYDTQYAQDMGNCIAKADIVVDDVVLAKDVPATYLLFLEKKVSDLATVISTMPTLSSSENWTMDSATGTYKTSPTQTLRTKKEKRVLVRAAATDKHPAQTDVYDEDVPEGHWHTVKLSTALTAVEVEEMSVKLGKLNKAIKTAREMANTTSVQDGNIAESLLRYVFNK